MWTSQETSQNQLLLNNQMEKKDLRIVFMGTPEFAEQTRGGWL